jgi:phosphoribosylamine--glycine ligase / phosphoribosylglycinamide formyltransferase / phosphoribosylformylglycinamidine cyclo-ligase
VKASGLAAGKGVVVAADAEEACKAVDSILTKREFGVAGDVLVIEELLEGEEVSVNNLKKLTCLIMLKKLSGACFQ